MVRQAVGEEEACQPDAAAKLAVRRMAVEHADYEYHPAVADISARVRLASALPAYAPKTF